MSIEQELNQELKIAQKERIDSLCKKINELNKINIYIKGKKIIVNEQLYYVATDLDDVYNRLNFLFSELV